MREETNVPPTTEEGVLEACEGPEFKASRQDSPAALSPEERYDDGKRRQLAPARIKAERLNAMIAMLVLSLPATGGLLLMWIFSDWNIGLRWGISLAVPTALGALGMLAYCWPALEHRHTTWSLNDGGVEIRRGVIWRHVIVVPHRRIQHTDVSQGPVQRRFGLGTLIMHTAGTHSYEISLEGIAHGTALWVRDALLQRKAEASAEDLAEKPIDRESSVGHTR